jgi:glycine/D-amino acid oxidase-like deaminating enzyme
MFDFLVIGKGLFGSAAAKYLSSEARRVAVVGPDEPQDVLSHDGVFASHYDQGRLAGLLARGPEWTALCDLSVRAFPYVEAASGIRFYMPAGRLYMPAAYLPGDYVAEMEAAYDLDLWHLSAAEQQQAFPYLRFPGAENGVLERAPAGYINPRALIKAQLAIAEKQGAGVIREQVAAVDSAADHLLVRTKEGNAYQARKVLIAAGAFSNFIALAGRSPGLPLRLKTETILLAEVPPSEARRLRQMPAVDYGIDSPVLDGIYLLPPLLYPDGRYYVKMGCDTAADQFLETLDEVAAWFKTGNSDVHKEELVDALLSVIPALKADSFRTGRCIVTYTTHRRPYIDAIVPDRVYTAVGGNGIGAKTSDAIGRLAARLMRMDSPQQARDGFGVEGFDVTPAAFQIAA